MNDQVTFLQNLASQAQESLDFPVKFNLNDIKDLFQELCLQVSIVQREVNVLKEENSKPRQKEVVFAPILTEKVSIPVSESIQVTPNNNDTPSLIEEAKEYARKLFLDVQQQIKQSYQPIISQGLTSNVDFPEVLSERKSTPIENNVESPQINEKEVQNLGISDQNQSFEKPILIESPTPSKNVLLSTPPVQSPKNGREKNEVPIVKPSDIINIHKMIESLQIRVEGCEYQLTETKDIVSSHQTEIDSSSQDIKGIRLNIDSISGSITELNVFHKNVDLRISEYEGIIQSLEKEINSQNQRISELTSLVQNMTSKTSQNEIHHDSIETPEYLPHPIHPQPIINVNITDKLENSNQGVLKTSYIDKKADMNHLQDNKSYSTVPTDSYYVDVKNRNSNRDHKMPLSNEGNIVVDLSPKINDSPSINANNILEEMLGLIQSEIEINNKKIMGVIDKSINESSEMNNKEIAQMMESLTVDIQRVTDSVTDMAPKLNHDVPKLISESNIRIESHETQISEILNQIQKIDNLYRSLSESMSKPIVSQPITIKQDGKIDLSPVFDQITSMNRLNMEMNVRLTSLEKSEKISPSSIAQLFTAINGYESKFNMFESTIVSLEMKLGEIREKYEDIKRNDRTAEQERKFQALRNIVANLEDDSKRNIEMFGKIRQENTQTKISLNEIEVNVSKNIEDINEVNKNINTLFVDQDSLSNRMKKVIALVQNETSDIASQIKIINEIMNKHDSILDKPSSTVIESINKMQFLSNKNEAKIDNVSQKSPMSISLSISSSLSNENLSEQKNIENQSNHVSVIETSTSPHNSIYSTQPETVKVILDNPKLHNPDNVTRITNKSGIDQNKQAPTKSSLPKLKTVIPKPSTQQESTRNEQFRFDEIIMKVSYFDSSIVSLKSAIDLISKQIKLLFDCKADKDALQNMFEQFRQALAELNNRVGLIRKSLSTKVEQSELMAIKDELTKEVQAVGETAAGTETVKCLVCGQPRKQIVGAIDDPNVKTTIGNGISSRVTGTDPDGNVFFVYGDHGEMYYGRSTGTRRIVPEGPILEPPPTESSVPQNEKNTEAK